MVAVQVGSFIQQVGASSISGAAGGLGVIRQGAPMVAALLLGGAAGSAVATDLGGVIVAVQVGSFIQQVGASSISGAAGGLGVIRQGAPMVAALLLFMGLAAGYAINVGFHTIREEVDALRVMGVDPVQRLVAPRVAAMVLVAPVLCAFIIFMGLAAGYAINVGFQSGTPGSYIASFASFASVGDVVVAMLKTWLFGMVVILVAC
ncbi:ABC transporter permease, partial [Mycolicibacter minnesotensis]|uniref:ABC transporter permease n=1 Tax=Mycolicibacter minnesotensis TaxID=1118379 RepID=UPI0021F38ED5